MEPYARVLRSSATFNTMLSPASWRSCQSFNPLRTFFPEMCESSTLKYPLREVQRELNQTFLPECSRSRAWHLAASSSSAVISSVSGTLRHATQCPVPPCPLQRPIPEA